MPIVLNAVLWRARFLSRSAPLEEESGHKPLSLDNSAISSRRKAGTRRSPAVQSSARKVGQLATSPIRTHPDSRENNSVKRPKFTHSSPMRVLCAARMCSGSGPGWRSEEKSGFCLFFNCLRAIWRETTWVTRKTGNLTIVWDLQLRSKVVVGLI